MTFYKDDLKIEMNIIEFFRTQRLITGDEVSTLSPGLRLSNSDQLGLVSYTLKEMLAYILALFFIYIGLFLYLYYFTNIIQLSG